MYFVVWTLFIVLAVYFLMVRPQRRRLQEHQALMAALRPGNEVVTAGGIYGTIQSVEDDSVHVEIAPGTVIRLAKRAVMRNLAVEAGGGPRAALEEPPAHEAGAPGETGDTGAADEAGDTGDGGPGGEA